MIGQWQSMTCGQFITNCLSLSRTLVPICATRFIDQILDSDSDRSYEIKFDILSRYRPIGVRSQGIYWHNLRDPDDPSQPMGFIDSNNWLALRPYIRSQINIGYPYGTDWQEQIWQDADAASRRYYDKFWRADAIRISNAGLGFVIKTHHVREAEGLRHLMPQAKSFCLTNFTKWQKISRAAKTGLDRSWLTDQDIAAYFADDHPMPSATPLHLDNAMDDENSFITQMEHVYHASGLRDFDRVRDYLLKYRKMYLRWTAEFSRS